MTTVDTAFKLPSQFGRREVIATCTAFALMATTLAATSLPAAAVSADLRIMPYQPTSFREFGGSVAVSADGSTLVVGATDRSVDGLNESAVIVFEADGDGSYEQRAVLVADDPSPLELDSFGYAVDVAADGATVVVGASGDNDAGETSGSVYVYEREVSGDYEQTAKLTAENAAAGDIFGESVAIDALGETIVVGARGHLDGTVFVFRADGDGDFQQSTTFSPADIDPTDAFGFSLSMSSDAGAIAVSATSQADQRGAVYVFNADGAGGYDEHAKLTTSDAGPLESFGSALSISADGSTIAAGSTDRASPGNAAGAIYLFVDGGSGYGEVQKISASDAGATEGFGQRVAVSEDGPTLLVGARFDDSIGRNSGSAYVFTADGNGTYDKERVLTETGVTSSYRYGSSVAISADGRTLLVGSPFYREALGPITGAAYVYGPHVHDPAIPALPAPGLRPADDQILRLYQAVFGRAPDTAGFEFWTSQYRDGVTLERIVDGFIASPEFVTRYGSRPSSRQLVDAMYLNVLNRAGEADGVSYWVSRLETGLSVNELLRSFADSPENIIRTRTSEPLTSSEAKILRLYRAVFARDPDQKGLEYWSGQAGSGQSMPAIAKAFAESSEFTSRYGADPSDSTLVDRLYRNVLDRGGDPTGIQFWLGRRADGMTVPELLIAFADSTENLNRTGTQP